MARNYIIYLPEIGENQALWAMANDSGSLVGEPVSGTIAQAAEAVEGRRAIVVLPGDSVLLAEATIPGGSAARVLQAIPYALEEQVADDIDKLHFAVGSKPKSDKYPVAIIGRDSMDTLKEQFSSVGLRPAEMVPETLALPKYDRMPEGEVWTALIDEDQTVVRLNGYKGFATDSLSADIMLNGARREAPEDHEAGGIVVFHTNEIQPDPNLPGMEIETRRCDSRLGLYAAGLASSPTINLLQGDYSLKQQFDKAWKPWRWTLGLIGLLGLVFAGGSVLDYIRLGQHESQIDAEIERVFKQALPGVPVRNPKAQMLSRIRAAKGGSVVGGFVVEFGNISDAVASLPKAKLESIDFSKGSYNISLETDSYPSLDRLQSDIEKHNSLKMSVTSAKQSGGVIKARIRLEPK